MGTESLPRILCVDDEPCVLESISRVLRRRYDIATAESGAAAIDLLQRDGPFVAIVSDMRMPGMDGAAFLARARQIAPDATRVLLTGGGDLDAAIAAVNEGQIFRFLAKPCPPPALIAAMDAAAEQHRLVTAERVLLEKTLHGSVKALTDILSLTNPVAFGRSTRIKRTVGDLAQALSISERWQVEVAAMFSQLGFITLPAETVEKVYYGRPLSGAEHAMVARLPAITEQLLGNIPRLETVREILAGYAKPPQSRDHAHDSPHAQFVARCAHVLRLAVDFDALETQGTAKPIALDTLRGRADRYDPEVLAAFVALSGEDAPRAEVREVPANALRVGMVFADDVKTHAGTLLVARGYEVTLGLLERLRNFRPGTVREPVRVIVRPTGKEG